MERLQHHTLTPSSPRHQSSWAPRCRCCSAAPTAGSPGRCPASAPPCPARAAGRGARWRRRRRWRRARRRRRSVQRRRLTWPAQHGVWRWRRRRRGARLGCHASTTVAAGQLASRAEAGAQCAAGKCVTWALPSPMPQSPCTAPTCVSNSSILTGLGWPAGGASGTRGCWSWPGCTAAVTVAAPRRGGRCRAAAAAGSGRRCSGPAAAIVAAACAQPLARCNWAACMLDGAPGGEGSGALATGCFASACRMFRDKESVPL